MQQGMMKATIPSTLLDCPVCLTTLQSPVSTCYNGHSICGKCKLKLALCPMCQLEFMPFRNRAMEEVVDSISVFCEHRDNGCNVTSKKAAMDEHIPECEFRLVTCLSADCPAGKMVYRQFENHFLTEPSHESSVRTLMNFEKTYCFDSLSGCEYKFMNYQGNNFFIFRAGLTADKNVWGCVHYFGRSVDAKRYMYFLTINQDHVVCSYENYCLPYIEDPFEITTDPNSFVNNTLIPSAPCSYKLSIVRIERLEFFRWFSGNSLCARFGKYLFPPFTSTRSKLVCAVMAILAVNFVLECFHT